MEIGKVIVEGIEAEEILNIGIKAKFNCHATLKVKCVIKRNNMERVMSKIKDHTKITLKERKQLLFQGYAQKAECNVQEEYAELILWAVSSSWFLDRKKKTKSYQDISCTNESLIRSKTEGMFYDKPQPIETIQLQYKETDWEFLGRFSSKWNLPMYPDMLSETPFLKFGIDKKKRGYEIRVREILEKKDLLENKLKNKNGVEEVSDFDAYYICVGSDQWYQIGDAVWYKGRTWYISSLECHMNYADFYVVYELRSQQGCKCLEQYLYDMAGAALEGRVIAVQGEKIKVHLNVDERQEVDRAYWFPFSTLQSAADGSGWYYMPEKGDAVKVCIPGWEERGAFAVSAVSTYEGKDAKGDKMSDTNQKYMRNPSGKELKMYPSGIKADGGGKASYMQLEDDGTMAMKGREKVQFLASETIEVVAGKKIIMESENIVDLKADTTGELILNESGEIIQLGGQVNVNSED